MVSQLLDPVEQTLAAIHVDPLVEVQNIKPFLHLFVICNRVFHRLFDSIAMLLESDRVDNQRQ